MWRLGGRSVMLPSYRGAGCSASPPQPSEITREPGSTR
jgi:hypothetical protein